MQPPCRPPCRPSCAPRCWSPQCRLDGLWGFRDADRMEIRNHPEMLCEGWTLNKSMTFLARTDGRTNRLLDVFHEVLRWWWWWCGERPKNQLFLCFPLRQPQESVGNHQKARWEQFRKPPSSFQASLYWGHSISLSVHPQLANILKGKTLLDLTIWETGSHGSPTHSNS